MRRDHRTPFVTCARTIAAAIVAAPALLAAAASAQATDVTPPPQPDKGITLIGPVGGYALMALAAGLLITVSLIPARRGAQD